MRAVKKQSKEINLCTKYDNRAKCQHKGYHRSLLMLLMNCGTFHAGIRKAVRHARMAHKATKWPIKKILTGPVMRPDRTKLVK